MPSFNSAAIVQEITINAPPEKVRECLLNFDNIPRWNNKSIKGLALRRAGTGEAIPGIDAKPGDIITVSSGQLGDAEAVMEFNTPTRYGWHGGKFGFVAHHWYDFLPSPEGDGKTLFKQCETFEGGASFLFMAYSPLRGMVEGLFAGFNEDLKKAVEGV
ncbi:hypothetical protein LTR36_000104 [Oleoguttula mirabilis]|uniref:SRPBCC domain-containing protein n=1 Tax=Oleoguttula mirabilis TaxID=1507867 RepID=A0AAV9JXV8_9PEZI|nr:hypothetical protein LTR36_000104 [Oleoguttula mirabilis]